MDFSAMACVTTVVIFSVTFDIDFVLREGGSV